MVLIVKDLRLRPFQERDRKTLVSILTDADVMKWTLHDRVLMRSEADDFVSTFTVGDDVMGMHVVALTATDTAIGFAGFRPCEYLGQKDVEFGWVLARSHHGHGYATTLGRAFIHYGLAKLALSRVLAACHPLNAASEHILRDKLHMRFEAEVEAAPGRRRRVYSVQPSEKLKVEVFYDLPPKVG